MDAQRRTDITALLELSVSELDSSNRYDIDDAPSMKYLRGSVLALVRVFQLLLEET